MCVTSVCSSFNTKGAPPAASALPVFRRHLPLGGFNGSFEQLLPGLSQVKGD